MYKDFQDYAENLKPRLNAALARQLSRLLAAAHPGGPAAPAPQGMPHPGGPAIAAASRMPGPGAPLAAPGSPGSPQPGWIPAENGLLTGGKHLRGSLLCLIATTLGGSVEDALPRAVGVELIHTATLIHDDIVDQHRERRELPALWTLMGARRAVLLGDIIFSSALNEMNLLGREEGLIASRAIAEVSWGAYREPLGPAEVLEGIRLGVQAADYQKIIRLKTGVLFGAACQLGAVTARAERGVQEAWNRYGVKLGEAYQIADDLQEVRQALATGSLSAADLAQLAPALLHFRAGSRHWLLEALEREEVPWCADTEEELGALARAMQQEKERRMGEAAEEVAGTAPAREDFHLLTRSVPRDLIRMFDAQAPQACEPSPGQPFGSSGTGG